MITDAPSEVLDAARMGTIELAAATGADAESIPARGASLWNRDFLLLWQGQLVSSIGKQAFALTCMLAIKQLTGSGSVMGLLMALSMLPSVVLGPVAGVFVDRVDRRKLIAYTDIAGGLLVLCASAALFLVPSSTSAVIACMFAVTLATGLLDVFSQPAIGAAIPDIVPAERLEAANGFNMGSVQMAAFVAQGAAGALWKALGAAAMTLVNAVTYIYAGVTELFVSLPPPPRREAADLAGSGPWAALGRELREGLSYVAGNKGMLATLLTFAGINFLSAPLLVTLPFLAEDYLGLGPEWYGYMMAAFGVGALSGYLLSAARPARGKARAYAIVAGLFAEVGLMLLALAPLPAWFSVAVFFLFGVLNGIVNVSITTLLQVTTPRPLLGRVSALSHTLSGAAMPLGMALSGILFDVVGHDVPFMFLASAGSVFVCAVAPLVVAKGYFAFLSSDAPAVGAAAQDPLGA